MSSLLGDKSPKCQLFSNIEKQPCFSLTCKHFELIVLLWIFSAHGAAGEPWRFVFYWAPREHSPVRSSWYLWLPTMLLLPQNFPWVKRLTKQRETQLKSFNGHWERQVDVIHTAITPIWCSLLTWQTFWAISDLIHFLSLGSHFFMYVTSIILTNGKKWLFPYEEPNCAFVNQAQNIIKVVDHQSG